MKKKILLITGGSYSDIPLIKAGQELGYHVITSGNNPNDLGHKYSNEVQLEDFSNKEAMLELATKLNIDAICSSSNDFSVISSSYIAQKLNLKGHDNYDTTLKLHHKDKFKEFALVNNFLVPNSLSFSSIEDLRNNIKKITFPAIVKPIDLTGGKGIKKVLNKQELLKVASYAFEISKAGRIVIDDFVEGSLHSFSSIIKNKKIIFYFADNEYSYLNPYLVSTSTSPAFNIKKVKHILIEQTERLASLLNLSDGILHMQYLMNKDIINIVEFTRRMPGDLYYKPVKYSTGINYATYIVKASCGLDISELIPHKQKGYYSRHCIMSSKKGKFSTITFDKKIQDNILEKFIWAREGDEIEDILTYKAGVVFLKYNSEEEMIIKNKQITNLIKIGLR